MSHLELKNRTKEYYQNLKPLYSPALESNIYFNAKGFNHITFKNPRNPRPIADQNYRMRILSTGIKLLEKANIYQEHEETIMTDGKKLSYWGIVAIIDKQKIKIIIRSIGNGHKHFWSVIPAYTTSEKRDRVFKMKGDPDTD